MTIISFQSLLFYDTICALKNMFAGSKTGENTEDNLCRTREIRWHQWAQREGGVAWRCLGGGMVGA